MPSLTQEFVTLPVDALEPHPDNPRRGNVEVIAESIDTNGFYGAVIAQRSGEGPHRIIAGEHRWRAAQANGQTEVPALVLDVDDDRATRIMLADNRTTDLAGYDSGALASLLDQLGDGLAGTGYDAEALDEVMSRLPGGAAAPADQEARQRHLLSERFVAPPFSVLDARQGYWQARKRQWLDLGIKSEEGRPRNLLKMSDTVLAAQAPNRSTPSTPSGNDPSYYWKKREAEAAAGRPLTNAEFEADYWAADAYVGGTSIFDPVLCEIAYRWWSPPGGSVLDPFAGGSVRGVVASLLGRRYLGVELSAEQRDANEQQAADIVLTDPRPRWIEGDASDLPEEAGAEHDLLFSCPPYHDLERYSDDPRDLSNMDWADFLDAYAAAIRLAADRLADNRFAVWVVSEIRAPDGTYRGLVPSTIEAFAAADLDFYNEAALVTSVGSVALRAARIFAPARKLARSHQNVLVFVKGDPAKAAEAAGPVDGVDLSLPGL